MDRLWYEVGNEHNPTDPFGRYTAEVSADGPVRVEHHSRTGHRSWTATVDESFVSSLVAALETASFPNAPRVMPVPDDRLRTLKVTGGPEGAVRLPSEAAVLPGYAEAFAALDDLLERTRPTDQG